MQKGGYIYIMSNYQRSVLYIGVTSDLRKRLYEHQSKVHPNSFTAKYNLSICVYYEAFFNIEEAIAMEKQLKRWSRKKKDHLIDNLNKEWMDLTTEISKW